MMTTIAVIGVCLTLLVSLLGWAYQLGKSDARLSQNEKDIAELKRKQELSEVRHDEHERIFAEKIEKMFEKINEKLDNLPCKTGECK